MLGADMTQSIIRIDKSLLEAHVTDFLIQSRMSFDKPDMVVNEIIEYLIHNNEIMDIMSLDPGNTSWLVDFISYLTEIGVFVQDLHHCQQFVARFYELLLECLSVNGVAEHMSYITDLDFDNNDLYFMEH